MKFLMRGHGEALARSKSLPSRFARQFHRERAADDAHGFKLAGAECVFTRLHHAHGGGQRGGLQRDRSYFAIEILIDFQHGFAFVQ